MVEATLLTNCLLIIRWCSFKTWKWYIILILFIFRALLFSTSTGIRCHVITKERTGSIERIAAELQAGCQEEQKIIIMLQSTSTVVYRDAWDFSFPDGTKNPWTITIVDRLWIARGCAGSRSREGHLQTHFPRPRWTIQHVSWEVRALPHGDLD